MKGPPNVQAEEQTHAPSRSPKRTASRTLLGQFVCSHAQIEDRKDTKDTCCYSKYYTAKLERTFNTTAVELTICQLEGGAVSYRKVQDDRQCAAGDQEDAPCDDYSDFVLPEVVGDPRKTCCIDCQRGLRI